MHPKDWLERIPWSEVEPGDLLFHPGYLTASGSVNPPYISSLLSPKDPTLKGYVLRIHPECEAAREAQPNLAPSPQLLLRLETLSKAFADLHGDWTSEPDPSLELIGLKFIPKA